jgi:hypothetical protein
VAEGKAGGDEGSNLGACTSELRMCGAVLQIPHASLLGLQGCCTLNNIKKL